MPSKTTWLALSLLVPASVEAQTLPQPFVAVVEANNYYDELDLADYWASEKLDGIRAVWNGTQLLTRTGHPIHAPLWFTRVLPDHALEGELWAGRGHFALVQQTVLDQTPSDEAWLQIRFMLFDLPRASGDYRQRYQSLIELVEQIDATHIDYVQHQAIKSRDALMQQLERLSGADGEGIMLRKISALYRPGRSDDLIKLKQHQDAEAQVIGYRPGKGKYQGMMGAVLVRNSDGTEFAIGSGFSDEQRHSPPQIGSVVTYRFNGLTSQGKPRFARFMRVRRTD